MKNKKEENIWNIPNTLTFSRLIITFIIIYCIFARVNIVVIASLFAIGMITDFLDGQIARRFNRTTEFGRKFDMIADRFLMTGVALAFIIEFTFQGVLTRSEILQIFIIMTREIITFPFAVIVMTAGRGLPKARFIGKLTTFMQGITFPLIILNVYSDIFKFSFYLSILTGIIGVVSAYTYIKDMQKIGVK